MESDDIRPADLLGVGKPPKIPGGQCYMCQYRHEYLDGTPYSDGYLHFLPLKGRCICDSGRMCSALLKGELTLAVQAKTRELTKQRDEQWQSDIKRRELASGYNARQNGAARTACPYSARDRIWETHWLDGWGKANAEILCARTMTWNARTESPPENASALLLLEYARAIQP